MISGTVPVINKGEPLYEKGNDVEGHHIETVSGHPEKITDPENIEFLHHNDHVNKHRNQ